MKNIITKAVAEIRPADDENAEEHPNGAFDVILSAQSLDRDGDELKSHEWQQPLPEHITFDIDHGMNVASTVGSGKPFINDDGNLQVRGTYASIARAQEVRALVNEGHIRTTSVAFLTHKDKKDNAIERELLNGAFVAIPANRDAVILASKALETEDDDTPGTLAQATDAALDQAIELFSAVDAKSLPEEIQQAIALVRTAVLGAPDEPSEKSATDAETESADADDAAAEEAAAKSLSADEVELRARALSLIIQSYAL